MGKAVLIAIQPWWCELIASGEKKLEVRKTRPKLETPFKCYIYQTKAKWAFEFLRKIGFDEIANILSRSFGMVIGEFVCDAIDQYDYDYCTHPEIGMDYDCGDNWWEISDEDLACACLTESQFRMYAYPNEIMFGWHISDSALYRKPKKLNKFSKLRQTKFGMEPVSLMRPPQSWCYVEELKGGEG